MKSCVCLNVAFHQQRSFQRQISEKHTGTVGGRTGDIGIQGLCYNHWAFHSFSLRIQHKWKVTLEMNQMLKIISILDNNYAI